MVKFLESFQKRDFGLLGLITILVLTLIVCLLAFKSRNDQWNVWSQNKDIAFFNESPLLSTADGPYFLDLSKSVKMGRSISSYKERRFFPEYDKEFRGKTNKTELSEPSFFQISLLPISINFFSGLFKGDLLTTANLIIGGKTSSNVAICELWNGSSWTEVGDLNLARAQLGAAGTSSLAVAYGGATGPTSGSYTQTEQWNGTSWTEVNEMATARQAGSASGASQTSALYAGGTTDGGSTQVANTEEWSFPPPTASILQEGLMWFNSSSSNLKGYGKEGGILTSSFSSGGSLNTSRGYMAGCGSQTAGSVFGGSPYGSPPKAELHEQYDGSSWTETTDSNTAHSAGSSSTKGTQTAVIIFSGGPPSTGTYTESWNGSSWTEVNNLNTSRNNGPAGFGVQTSAICCGGNSPPLTTTESWDGTSWTAVNSMNGGRRNFAGCGPETAGIVAAGQGPGGTVNSSETWDGTSWTETNNLNSARRGNTMFGNNSSSAFCTGGGSSANNEFWNGSSWTELNNLSTGRNDSGAGGSSVAGFVAGGPQSGGSATEEWTATAAVVKVTTS